MTLVFRTLLVLAAASRRSRIDPFADSVRTFRVLPNDLDLNGHMNNGRFLSVMDLGRLELLVRLGVLREALRRRWTPVIGSASVRYRRSIAPFRRYRLETRLLCWDDRWLYFRQRFVRNGVPAGIAHVKGAIVSPDGLVSPHELIERAGLDPRSPSMPAAVRAWVEAEEALVLDGVGTGASDDGNGPGGPE